MKKYVLIFWELAGCVLIVAALSTAINYRKMVKQDAPADIKMDEAGDVGTAPDTDDKESGIPQNQPEDDTAADEPVYAQNDEGEDSGRYQGEIVLETEYEIKEYCKGCFIVSKNDDLLYGMLDIHGNEILPVEYDDISFKNSKKVLKGEDEKLYVEAKYEGEYKIFDSSANLIFDQYAGLISYDFGVPTSDSAFWSVDNKEDKVRQIYTEDKRLLYEINYSNQPLLKEKSVSFMMYWTSPDYYFGSVVGQEIDGAAYIGAALYLYNKNGEIIQQWNEAQFMDYVYCENNLKYFYVLFNDGIYKKYSLDDQGNVIYIQDMNMSEAEQEVAAKMYEEQFASGEDIEEGIYLGNDKNRKLYHSNGTFKLEDENGNAIYDERYYECYREDGCYILVNEDNQACLINRNGKMVIDYGWLDGENDTVHFLGEELDTDCLLDGGEEVGIVVKENGINKVYMFSEIAD